MNQEDLARCYCIISHPTKPKFLAVRTADGGWSPPWVEVPGQGFIGSSARMIAEQVKQSYGLSVTVLRHLFESPGHHCVELEVHSRVADRGLRAVWVGSEDYRKTGDFYPDHLDPFAAWLKDRESGTVPHERLPWERPGWFGQAVNWIHQELAAHNIQVTAPVQQFRAAWQSSAILRVGTSNGHYFFKAAFDQPPNETALTLALSERWPDRVPQPLAADAEKNWMLHPQFDKARSGEMLTEDYSSALRSLAGLQIDSVRDLERWRQLGCADRGAGAIDEFLANPGPLIPVLTRGEHPLDEEHLGRFMNEAESLRGLNRQLADHGIPDTLVHVDAGPANLYRKPDGFWILDWSAAMIGHPFVSLVWFIESLGRELVSQEGGQTLGSASRAKLRSYIETYLEPFQAHGSGERLLDALKLAWRVDNAHQLLRWSEFLQRLEPGSRSFRRVELSIQLMGRIWAANNGSGKPAGKPGFEPLFSDSENNGP